MSVVVLEDDPYRIEWNGSCTFNVFIGRMPLDVFSVGYGEPSLSEEQARAEAAEWWRDGGKDGARDALWSIG